MMSEEYESLLIRAKQVSFEEYLRKYEPNNFKVEPGQLRLKDHDSIVISQNLYCWHSQGSSGGDLIDFLVKVRNMAMFDAIKFLAGASGILPQYGEVKSKSTKIKERKPFILPPKASNTKAVEKYLQGRGIDADIIKDCIADGVIYQTVYEGNKANHIFNNVVFVGKDKENKAQFACIRSTYGNHKYDVQGSNKQYGFRFPASNVIKPPTAVSVFESPIDALSGATIAKIKGARNYRGIHRLSLGGTSDLALKHFLKDHPEVVTVTLCFDNDDAKTKAFQNVQKAIQKIMEMLKKLGDEKGMAYQVNVMPPSEGKDYNEMLKALRSRVTKKYQKGEEL